MLTDTMSFNENVASKEAIGFYRGALVRIDLIFALWRTYVAF